MLAMQVPLKVCYAFKCKKINVSCIHSPLKVARRIWAAPSVCPFGRESLVGQCSDKHAVRSHQPISFVSLEPMDHLQKYLQKYTSFQAPAVRVVSEYNAVIMFGL